MFHHSFLIKINNKKEPLLAPRNDKGNNSPAIIY